MSEPDYKNKMQKSVTLDIYILSEPQRAHQNNHLKIHTMTPLKVGYVSVINTILSFCWLLSSCSCFFHSHTHFTHHTYFHHAFLLTSRLYHSAVQMGLLCDVWDLLFLLTLWRGYKDCCYGMRDQTVRDICSVPLSKHYFSHLRAIFMLLKNIKSGLTYLNTL